MKKMSFALSLARLFCRLIRRLSRMLSRDLTSFSDVYVSYVFYLGKILEDIENFYSPKLQTDSKQGPK